MKSALIIVDVQHDFLPGGALAVPTGNEVIAPLVDEALSGRHALVVASQDWHPAGHSSFTENGGPWPTHCVAGTHGAALHPRIAEVAQLVVRKGQDRDLEAYSAFDGDVQDSIMYRSLHKVLRANGITHVTVGGLAREYCVAATADSADELGLVVDAPLDLSRGIQEVRDAG